MIKLSRAGSWLPTATTELISATSRAVGGASGMAGSERADGTGGRSGGINSAIGASGTVASTGAKTPITVDTAPTTTRPADRRHMDSTGFFPLTGRHKHEKIRRVAESTTLRHGEWCESTDFGVRGPSYYLRERNFTLLTEVISLDPPAPGLAHPAK